MEIDVIFVVLFCLFNILFIYSLICSFCLFLYLFSFKFTEFDKMVYFICQLKKIKVNSKFTETGPSTDLFMTSGIVSQKNKTVIRLFSKIYGTPFPVNKTFYLHLMQVFRVRLTFMDCLNL